MFRKLVSSLSFSPALVGQLGFYARRLRREEATRKVGLILTALALIVQSFAVFTPPESANASSPNDFVSGGVGSIDEYLQLYDNNSRSLKDIYNAAGITRDEIAATSPSSYDTNEVFIYGRVPGLESDNTRALGFKKSDSSFGTVYGKSSPNTESNNESGWAGYSDIVGWFAIAKSSGNLVVEEPIESAFSLPTVKYSKSARNLTQATEDASLKLVNGGDKIQFHLTATNTGTSAIEVPISDRLSDTLEYAQLVDTGGGKFDSEEYTLTWDNVTLQPGESQSRAFLVQLIDPVPATPQGLTDSSSHDCVMTNTFGNTVNLAVACPSVKMIESTVGDLPKTGIGANIAFSLILLSLTIYFYARSRQLQTEIRIIRRDLNAGAI